MGDSSRRKTGFSRKVAYQGAAAVVAVALGVLGASGFAGAAVAATVPPPTSGGNELSPRLDDLSGVAVSGDPAVATEEIAAAAGDLGVAETGPGSLQVDSAARVAVTVRYSQGPDAGDVAALAELATVTASSSLYGMASASVSPDRLQAVAALARVTSVVEALAPATSGASSFGSGTAGGASLVGALGALGAFGSPGAPAQAPVQACRTVEANLATALGADVAAVAQNVDGTGITVGVVSDSWATNPLALTTPEDDIEDGMLPGPGNACGYTEPVGVLRDSLAPATDEGRAMAQLVHSIAPGARLLFSAVGPDELTFAQSVTDLAAAGADVIVDDITILTDPFYQDGPIGYAIDQATKAGVSYLSAAGNFTVIGEPGHPSAGRAISSWSTEAYRPAPCSDDVLDALDVGGVASADCMDFDPGTGVDTDDTMTFRATPVGRSVVVAMQWAEPVGAAAGTFRFALVRPDGVVDVGPANASGLQSVIGATGVTNGDYGFVIIRDTSAGATSEVTPAMKFIMKADPYLRAVEYFENEGGDLVGPTITGHAGAAQTISVAASPFDDPLTVESYSSGGPVTTVFAYDPAVSPIATPLPAPVTISKPDITSVDGGYTNFFAADEPVGGGAYAFYGTSAASPAAAAVIALAREKRPDVSVDALRTALADTATPLTSPVPASFTAENVVGAGLIDAPAYLRAVVALPVPAPTPVPSPQPVPRPDAALATAGAPQLAATGAPLTAVGGPALAGLLVLLLGSGIALHVARGASRRDHSSSNSV